MTVQATKKDSSKVNLQMTGNITSRQISQLTITANPATQTTVVAFILTGKSGTEGFSNITIAKNQLPYGTMPIVYIDGKAASSQGYCEDAVNFYVWFTTSFSTHQVEIQFTGQSTTEPQSPILWYALIVVVAIMALVAGVLVFGG